MHAAHQWRSCYVRAAVSQTYQDGGAPSVEAQVRNRAHRKCNVLQELEGALAWVERQPSSSAAACAPLQSRGGPAATPPKARLRALKAMLKAATEMNDIEFRGSLADTGAGAARGSETIRGTVGFGYGECGASEDAGSQRAAGDGGGAGESPGEKRDCQSNKVRAQEQRRSAQGAQRFGAMWEQAAQTVTDDQTMELIA